MAVTYKECTEEHKMNLYGAAVVTILVRSYMLCIPEIARTYRSSCISQLCMRERAPQK